MRIPRSKTAVPGLPPEYTARPRLWSRLDEPTAEQLVVVVAPPGYGKTLLLADWVRHRAGPDTAWVTLDHDDGADARRLWAAVLTALTALPSVAAGSPLHRIHRSGPGPDGVDLVDEIVEALDAQRPPVRLVLDDVHELTAVHGSGLDRLVRRRPAGLRLILVSRLDPPLSLPRMRLEGLLCELRAQDLRFSLDEAGRLFQSSGLELNRTQVEILHRRTEGWAAGLRLAVLALRRTDDHDAFLDDFSGDEHSVADYLTGEVLSGLSADAVGVLRATSVCSRLPSSLAAGLAGRPDAGSVLDGLRQETALIERTAPDEYRIHALLRSYLAADLARHRPGLYRELQATAARWWADRDEPAHALRHAERAEDGPLLADLVSRTAVPLLLGGEVAPVRRALAAVGPAQREASPRLALTAALTHLQDGALPAAMSELRLAHSSWPPTRDPALDALRASTELLAQGLGAADNGRSAVPVVTDAIEPELRALLHAGRAAAELGRGPGGDLDSARAEIGEALRLGRRHGFGYFEVNALTLLAILAELQGDHPAMVAAAQEAIAVAGRHARHPSSWSGPALSLLAYADLLRGDPQGASARSDEALEHAEPLAPEVRYGLRAVRGCALADQGERARGLAMMRSARAEFGDRPSSAVVRTALAVLEHRVALMLGNTGAAAEVADQLTQQVGRVGEVLLLQAWTESAAGRHESARAIVVPLHSPGASLLAHTPIEVHLLDAEAALHGGDRAGGRAALEAGVGLGRSLDIVRPFALAGPRTRALLKAGAVRTGTAFDTRLASAWAVVRPDADRAISDRELAVLELLSSLLTAREIADELTVSVNTVKSHVRSIYAKLDVSTRRDAVARARERGLLA